MTRLLSFPTPRPQNRARRARQTSDCSGAWRAAAALCGLVMMPLAAFGQTAGLTTEWEIRNTLKDLVSNTERLVPMLDQINPQDWVSKGAPEAYLQQWKSLKAESGYLIQTTQSLAATPTKTTLTLQVYLRMVAMESMLESLTEGIRRYQNPALADLFQAMVTETNSGRARLRDYLVELVAAKEDELRIVDQEAQRCRSVLIKQPMPKQERKPNP